MIEDLTDPKWRALAESIHDKQCTPFLGAGACVPALPSGAELARDLAALEGYPLADREDLTRVAQFMVLKYGDAVIAKREILKRLAKPPPTYFSGDEPHHVLASLNLPVYLTTNYDDFMVRALGDNNRKPRRDYCRWTANLANKSGYIWERNKEFHPSVDEPLVYHLHGSDDVPRSIVITEDDYLDFLYNMVNTSAFAKTVNRPWEMFPPPVMDSISDHTLIFLGYRLSDWDFRIIFRWLVLTLGAAQKRVKVAVQLKVPNRIPNLAEIIGLGPMAPVDEQNLTEGSCSQLIGLLEQRKARLDGAINELWLRHAELSGRADRDPMGYVAQYFEEVFQVSVFWGTAREFVAKLRTYL